LLYKILADENVDFSIVKKLRENGFEVISVLNKYKDALSNKFSVIKVTKIRIREM